MCLGLPRWLSGKESPANAGDEGSVRGLGRFPWRGKWQPTPVFLPGESHGQRSLEGYSPWGHKSVGHDLATKQQQQTVLKILVSFYTRMPTSNFYMPYCHLTKMLFSSQQILKNTIKERPRGGTPRPRSEKPQ